jgi:hypothetical protein
MKLRKLMATKPHKYGTRHLTAGEEYEVPPRHAIALVAGRKARFADKPIRNTPVQDFVEYMHPKTIVGQIGGDEERPDIDRLRLEATQLGIDIDGRWGVVRLQHEIAQVKR